jgi:hypothetical protein
MLIAGGIAGAAAGAGGTALIARLRLRPRLQAMLSDGIGPALASHPEAIRFLDHFIAFMVQDGWLEGHYLGFDAAGLDLLIDRDERLATGVLTAFGVSSTVLRTIETGEELQYFGLFDPYNAPCLNQLAELSD